MAAQRLWYCTWFCFFRFSRKLLALSDLDGHFLYECYKEHIPLHEASATEALPLLQPNSFFAAALGGSATIVAYLRAAERRSPRELKSQGWPEASPNVGFTVAEDASQARAEGDETGSPEVPASLETHSGTACTKVKDLTIVCETTEPNQISEKLDTARRRWGSSCVAPVWVETPPLRASCELMYRSLLGIYAMQSARLKYER